MEDKAEITTKRGNKVTRDGDEDNPAIIIKAASGSDAIKKVSAMAGCSSSRRLTPPVAGFGGRWRQAVRNTMSLI